MKLTLIHLTKRLAELASSQDWTASIDILMALFDKSKFVQDFKMFE
jgi:hypothetical protein